MKHIKYDSVLEDEINLYLKTEDIVWIKIVSHTNTISLEVQYESGERKQVESRHHKKFLKEISDFVDAVQGEDG